VEEKQYEDIEKRPCLQAEERALARSQLYWHLDFGLPVSRIVRSGFLLFCPLYPG
jgi:hypothetical protein